MEPKPLIIEDRKEFKELITNKNKIFKHIIDSSLSFDYFLIEVPSIYSIIKINYTKKLLKEIYQEFIKKEEYEYVAKLTKHLN